MNTHQLILGAFILSCYSITLCNEPNRRIRVYVTNEVDFVVTDPSGKRSGFNPYSKVRYDEINSLYGTDGPFGEDALYTNEFMTDDPLPGEYQLSVFGVEISVFEVGLLFERPTATNDNAEFRFQGVIDSDMVLTYRFNYPSNAKATFVALKNVTAQIVRDELDICLTNEWITDASLAKQLTAKIDSAETALGKSDTAAANRILQRFINTVQHNKGKNIDPDAVSMFVLDAETLISGVNRKHR